MGSTPLRRPLNGPRRRAEEVIEAAAAVFAERGYHGASTQDIADRLGMRQASLYYYFPSKEAALEVVCLRGGEGYVEHALAAANGRGTPIDKLCAILRSHLRAMGESPAFSRAFLRERRFLPQEARRRVGRVARRYERIIEGVLEAGIAAGELRGDLDARLAMLGLLGMANAAVDWHDKKPGLTIERIADSFARLAVVGIAAKRGAG
jgi:TetR/AcrR family transcriptional regulator, cholesterol catabolism regulator